MYSPIYNLCVVVSCLPSVNMDADAALNNLKWSEDDRSIGFSDPDESKAYIPVIGWNFDIIK